MHLIFFKGSCQTVFEAETINDGLVTLVYLFNVSILNMYPTDNLPIGTDINII